MYLTDNFTPESFYFNFEPPEQEYEEDIAFTEEDMEEIIEDEI